MVPSESEEDDFFARGEVNSSFPPSAMDVTAVDNYLEESPQSKPLSPAMLERRARLRRVVGVVVGAAALLTGLVGAKALSAPATRVVASEGSLNVPHQVVPSIAIALEEPAAGPAAGSEKAASPDPAAPSSIDPAPAGENPATQATAQPGAKPEENAADKPAPVATARRLPGIDVEIPATTDPATDKQWESAAKNVASQDFKGADSVLAELSKRSDPATRETARLARAVWWTANGRQNEVKPVIADLAANATTPSVRHHARELLSAN